MTTSESSTPSMKDAQRHFRVRITNPVGKVVDVIHSASDRSIVQATVDAKLSEWPAGSKVEIAQCGVGEPTIPVGPPRRGRFLWTLEQKASYEYGYYTRELRRVEGVLDHMSDFSMQGLLDSEADYDERGNDTTPAV